MSELTPRTGAAFRAAMLREDASRPISGNLLHGSGSMPEHFDVVGISHANAMPAPYTPTPASGDPRWVDWLHEHHPGIAFVGSESSSCNTQRGANVVDHDAGVYDDVFNADCLSKHYCPPNVTSAQAAMSRCPGAWRMPGRCTQSWTMAYNSSGALLPWFGGTLGIVSARAAATATSFRAAPLHSTSPLPC